MQIDGDVYRKCVFSIYVAPRAAQWSPIGEARTFETLKLADDTCKNIPMAEYQSVMNPDEQGPVLGEYIAIDPRRTY